MNNDEQLLKDIKNAKTITVLTGAGISTASGIPDYRSKQGLYNTVGPESILTPSCLKENPTVFHEFVTQNMIFENAEPNVIHKVLSKLQENKNINIVTQNIDDLHEKAGSKNIIHMHGTIDPIYCIDCGHEVDIATYKKDYKCPKCGSVLRPSFVLYYENINLRKQSIALEKIINSDLILVIGTTLKVYPFANLMQYADNYGKKKSKIVLINNEDIEGPFSYRIINDAIKIFEKINNDL